jgi:hypothetical protein
MGVMPEAKTYQGSCHCGKVTYEITTTLERVLECNCSICSRAGYLLTFVPAERFKLLSGEESLEDYQFNRHKIHHLFCTTCGIHACGRGEAPGGKYLCFANVRCLSGVELDSLTITPFDGKSL